jgi:hypothetical protein
MITAAGKYSSWNPMISRLTSELSEGNVAELMAADSGFTEI